MYLILLPGVTLSLTHRYVAKYTFGPAINSINNKLLQY